MILPSVSTCSCLLTRQRRHVFSTSHSTMDSSLDARQDLFKHAPLDLRKSSIRLIRVLPLDDSGIVQCTISLATIDAQYTCLSYVWGRAEETHMIHINGQPFQVRRNLWEFLHTVADQSTATIGSDHEEIPGLNLEEAADSLWIDALCIDQENNGEKNHQVQQMGKIFSGAQRVIAWVGNKPRIASMFRYLREYWGDDLQEKQGSVTDHWIAFRDFGTDVYWRRAWVS